MPNTWNRKALWLAATSIATGTALVSFLKTNSPDEAVKLSSDAQSRLASLNAPSPTKATLTAPQFNQATSQPTETIPAATHQAVKIEGMSAEDINLSRYFYTKFAKAKTPKAKIENLRWALQQYRKNTYDSYKTDVDPQTFEKASLGLGIDKSALIKMARNAAISLFKDLKEPDSSASNLEKVIFWNTQALVYNYTGLDDNGTYSDSIAHTNTGTSDTAIENQKNIYLKNAIVEITPNLIKASDAFRAKVDGLTTTECDWFCAQNKVIDAMPLAQKLQYRNEIGMVRYVLQQDHNISAYGLTRESYSELESFSRELEVSIGTTFQKLSEGMTINQRPQKSDIPSTQPS